MIPFITYREPNEKNELEYFILQRAFPNYIGRVVAYPVEGALANVPVSAHHLYITFAGCLMGNYIPGNKDELANISFVFDKMSAWYYSNRIEVDLKKYKKWRVL